MYTYVRIAIICGWYEFMLEQIVTQPTRDSNTLGLCVSPHTLHGLIQGPDIVGTFLPGLSDHNVVIVSFATISSIYKINLPFIYKKADWASLSEEYFYLIE